MSLWFRIPTDFLRYWEERCVAVLAATELEIVDRTYSNKKPTAGQLAVQDIQGRQLTAIRAELNRRANA